MHIYFYDHAAETDSETMLTTGETSLGTSVFSIPKTLTLYRAYSV